MTSFLEKLEFAVAQSRSLLCIGLDPDPTRVPERFLGDPDPVFAFNRSIIDATADLVCAYKPNIAFYEALGIDGLQALKKTIDYVPQGLPVILDAKRGDIGSTAQAYARAAFEYWRADAVTVNPFLGYDAVEPFLSYADRGILLLCRTSNPGASDFQGLPCPDRPLYLVIAEKALEWNTAGNVGLVMGATYPRELALVREIAPDLWFLVPGVGSQGGDLRAALRAGLDARGAGLMVNVSRQVIYTADPRSAAQGLRDALNGLRDEMAAPSGRDLASRHLEGQRETLVRELQRIGAVRFGDFTLKSGSPSPIYLDLRLLVSHPDVLAQVACAYAQVLERLEYHRLAAIPYAALPIGTAVALETGRPLIYPRREAKEYGTRKVIEWEFRPGETAVVLDDVITTGASKVEALSSLKEAGLQVQDVVVLIDREQGGKASLERRGYRLHAVMTITEMVETLSREGLITGDQRAAVLRYLGREG
ncbi:MAG: orotidine-5'-phosphate decarboxylase [Chloroflexi bacterium]|nr:orotidine-5'-phosphate decarboxylase [Chloroflexota bacterium]